MQDFMQLQIESIILSFKNNALIELEVKKYSKCIALVIKKNKKKTLNTTHIWLLLASLPL